MKTIVHVWITAIAALASLAGSTVVAAQESTLPARTAKRHHYKLLDMGTLGGPQSYVNNGNDNNSAVSILNNRGILAGWADTSTPDPFPTFCFNEDCYVSHGFSSDGHVRTNLGTLVPGLSSQANWISSNGLIAGVAENGDIDPLISGLPETRAVLWRDNKITNLGTLPDGGYESWATAVNSRGQVIGWALNTIPDDDSMIDPTLATTQTRAFLWQNGTMQDLKTLGSGSDAQAQFINERGQVVGWSYTGSAQNPTACLFPLATHSFVWSESQGMVDLGTLGGECVIATGINAAGVIIGDNVDDVPIQRSFIWRDGLMEDLGGTIGGLQAGAEAISQAGQVAGFATLAGEAQYHATLWKHVGEITDLGVVCDDLCSFASSLNSHTQVVGASSPDCTFDNSTRAALWDHGSVSDLNTLVGSAAELHLQAAQDINDQGEIGGIGLDSGGNSHAFLLIPCDDNHPNLEGCDYSLVESSPTLSVNSTPKAGTSSPNEGAPVFSGPTIPMRLHFGRRFVPRDRGLAAHGQTRQFVPENALD